MSPRLASFPTHAQIFGLSGRTALVTGAAGHLGSAMAVALARAGAHVILNGRSKAKLEAFADELAEEGLSVQVAAFDVLDHAAAASFFATLKRLDVLVNNAVTGLPTTADASRADAFAATLASGITAVNENVQAALPALKAAARAVGQASVINIASIYGHRSPSFATYGDSGFDSPPQYAASKGGMIALTRYLACRLAPDGVRVNSLSPGVFPWPEIEQAHPNFVARSGQRTPMERTGRWCEIGGPAVFLASDASAYMTGADLLVDGGWTAW
ncbi:SDR family NAD(P)-dependent oxidoreductase [Phenylobacterium montanum]|uniref:SDR family oxidoreductase n=1 Tax=Phenylobacterium montanum TaxID=2823693 RepID=A0A975G3Z0_9CAUL|nr:SDR family oxidoreductase [Caulobacter sp. S6]QUD90364.1 SDR family oxidoreductase [Caulobacter sp. S6]